MSAFDPKRTSGHLQTIFQSAPLSTYDILVVLDMTMRSRLPLVIVIGLAAIVVAALYVVYRLVDPLPRVTS